mgnify:CR=1 FL=1
MLKAFHVALSLLLLAAIVKSSATNTTDGCKNETTQNAITSASLLSDCGHYYFPSSIEYVLGFSNESRHYASNGVLEFPKDVALKILTYLIPVNLSEPEQAGSVVDSLFRFEKLYGLTRYVGKITVEQIHALETMEDELGIVFERDSEICRKLLVARRDALGNLRHSLLLKLTSPSTSTLWDDLCSMDFSDDPYAVQAAIRIFVEELVERFKKNYLEPDFCLLNAWKFVSRHCEDFGVIRRFAQMLPESDYSNNCFTFLPLIPFENYPQYLEYCEHYTPPTDDELRMLSSLFDHHPMVNRTLYFKQYKQLIGKYQFPQCRAEILDGIIAIRYGSRDDIVSLNPYLVDKLSERFGPRIRPLFWDSVDFSYINKRIKLRKIYWSPLANLVIHPKHFLMPIKRGRIDFEVSTLYMYDLHQASNTIAKKTFEAKLFEIVEVISQGHNTPISSAQVDLLVYAMDYAYKTNRGDVVDLACSVINARKLSNDTSFFNHLTMLVLPQPKRLGITLKRILHSTDQLGVSERCHSLIVMLLFSESTCRVDLETLKLLVDSERLAALNHFNRKLEENAVPPKYLLQFFKVFGYLRHDILAALCGSSTDPWLNLLFDKARTVRRRRGELPRYHSLWFYFWMAHREEFEMYAPLALVVFYRIRYLK